MSEIRESTEVLLKALKWRMQHTATLSYPTGKKTHIPLNLRRESEKS